MGSHELVCQRAFSWSFSASPSPKEALSEIWPMDYMKTRDFYCWTMFGIAGGMCERRITLHAVRGIFQRLAAIATLLGQFVGVLSSSSRK